MATTTFGATVRQRRRALDLTQAELADQAGFAAITIRRIESGERRPSKELIEALARALQIPDDERDAFARLGRQLVGEQPSPAPREHVPSAMARFQPPLPPLHWVHRPALMQVLDDATRAPLTTVVAAPGFGKTSTLAHWADRTGAAWLTLSRAEADVVSAAAAITGALALQVPGLRAPAAERPTNPAGPDGEVTARAEAIAGQLTVAIGTSLGGRSLPLVLDDVDALPPGCGGLALLEALVRQSPPGLHLVVASRVDLPFPIDRLRLQGMVSELGPDLLRLDPEAVGLLLGSAPADDRAALARRIHDLTDGWPAAARLLVDWLGGTHGWEARIDQWTSTGLAATLTREVLTSCDDDEAHAVQTLALVPAFDADLCERLGLTAGLIDTLASRGVVVMRADGGTWEVSAIIRSGLTSDLTRTERQQVLRTAAQWCADRRDWAAGVGMLRSGGDDEGLLAFLDDHAAVMVSQGQAATVVQAAQDVDPEARSVDLEQSLGQALLVVGRWEESLACMRRVTPSGPTPARIARWTGVVHHLRGDLPEAIAAYASAEDGPATDPDRATLRAMHAAASWVMGDIPGSRALAELALSGAQESGDTGALAAAHTVWAMLAAGDGDRRANDVHDRLALEFAERAGDALQTVRIRSNRGSHLVETGDFELALDELTLAIELAEITGYAPFLALARSNRGEALAGLGRHEEAVAEFLAAAELYDRLGSRLVGFPLLGLADVHLLRGDVEQAAAHYERVLALAADGGSRTSYVRAAGGLARILIGRSPARARQLVALAHSGAEGMALMPGLLATGWVALIDGDRAEADRVAALARDGAERRRDLAGYAEACELSALASTDGRAAAWAEAAVDTWERLDNPFRRGVAHVLRDALAGEASAVHAGWAALRRLGMRDPVTTVAGPLAAVAGGHAPAIPPGVFGAVEPRVSVRLLGGLSLRVRGVTVPRDQLSPLAWEVLATSAAGCGQAVTLDDLVGDGADASRASVERAVRELQDVLGQGADPDPDWYLARTGDSVRLQTDHLDLDVATFLAESARVAEADTDDREVLERCAALEASYPGDLDPGSGDSGIAEECRAAYLDVLRQLVRGHRRAGATQPTVRYALRLLTLDPNDEPTALTLVETLDREGRFGEARRHYRRYTARMRALGVEPSPYPRRSPA